MVSPFFMKNEITLPNGSKRPISVVRHPLAAKVMRLAKTRFAEAANLRDTDWTEASNRWVQAVKLEEAAIAVDEAARAAK